jgi:uroporphyrinogen-III decarboxylase
MAQQSTPKEKMTSRERVHAAALGQPVDRVPVTYWINPHMACKMMSTHWPGKDKKQARWGKLFWTLFPKQSEFKGSDFWRALPTIINGYANSKYALERGADIAIAPATGKLIDRTWNEHGRMRIRDTFGSVRAIGGIYADVIEPAVKNIEDLNAYQIPDPTIEQNYLGIRQMRAEHPEASIMVETFGVQDFLCTQLWKMDAAMMAMYDHPQEIKAFQKRFADWAIEIAVRGVRAGADIVLIYDDYGYTGRPLISVKMWEEFTYPHLRRLIDAAHEEGALAMLHSCGYQMPFLKYYVEAGLDILQPFQPKAGNDFTAAVEQVGNQLTFCTGIDIQLGELMTAEELRTDILKYYQIGKKTGRHILGTTHMLQYTMPEENTKAIFRTVAEIQSGVHG